MCQMPPPKRPFTTSSLTSSLRSTFANQPLLSNLTNLDKLTEHATNLAHKAPFFDALNEQFQQARAQDIAPAGRTQQPPPSTTIKSTASIDASASHQTMNTQANSKFVQNVANPNVDMSHLSQQERLMIQSVIAKAEMSEVGSNANSTIPNPVNMNQLSQLNQPMLQQQNQRGQPGSMMSQPFQQSQMRQGLIQNTEPFQQTLMQMTSHPTQQQMSQQQQGFNPSLSLNQQIGNSQPLNMPSSISGRSGPQQAIGQQSMNQNNIQSTFDQINPNRDYLMHQTPNQPNQQQGFNQAPFNSLRAQLQINNLENQNALNNPIAVLQQNPNSNQNQAQCQFGQLMQQQQDAQAANQQQILAPSQRVGPVQPSGLLGFSSSQIPIQANGATFMQPLNVIGQPNINNQSNPTFQCQQQLLFRDRNDVAIADAVGNLITPSMQNLIMHNQQLIPLQAFPSAHPNPQPESILRNRDGRDGIRFSSDTFRGDYPASDHETYDDQRHYRGSRKRDDRSLRRYNSMESNSRVRQLSRERSRDPRSTYESSPPGVMTGLTRQRQLPKLAELGKQPVQQKSSIQSPNQPTRDSRRLRSTPTMRRSARSRREYGGDSLSLSSESDLEDASISSSISAEKRRRAQRSIGEKRTSPRLQQCARNADCQLDDESIKRLGELKLSEQANQVMEQQQLLIQQSQELIKLQQTQLEKQSRDKEIKESAPSRMNLSDKQTDHSGSNANPQTFVSPNLDCSSESRRTKPDEISQRVPMEVTVVRNAGIQTQQMRDSTPRAQISKATSVDSIHLINIEDDADLPDSRVSRMANQSAVSQKFKSTSIDVTGLERVSIPRYGLNFQKSPNETTDSDAELVSRRSSSRRHHGGLVSSQSNRHARVPAIHRREPMGLPPSPLPISAAIQLHQLQQKHSRDESDSSTRWAKNRRDAYSRSRSVCNSPNRTPTNATFSHSIDEGKQPNSSGAMSAFGLQRKRLPEPPSNSMPLTPSMVRKMIEAQKSAATSSNKLLTSVNAQSTLLTNMHTDRNPCFDRAPSEALRQALLSSRPISRYLSPNSYARRSLGSCGAQVSFVDPNSSLRISSDRENNDPCRIDYSKYTKSNYCNSILKGSRNQDLLSKPRTAAELERRFPEVDYGYGSDSRYQPETSIFTSDKSSRFDDRGGSSAFGRASNKLSSANMADSILTSSYIPKPSYQFDSVRGCPGNYRRNSSGEGASLPRFDRSPNYSRQNYPHPDQITGATYSDRTKDQSYWSSQSAISSPTKRFSRFQTTNEHYPGSRYDLSSREISTTGNRHLSHWPTSYLDSVASPRVRHFGMSLEGVDSSRLDTGRWSAGSLGRYQASRGPDFDRDVLRDQTRKRNDWYADRTGVNRSMMRYLAR